MTHNKVMANHIMRGDFEFCPPANVASEKPVRTVKLWMLQPEPKKANGFQVTATKNVLLHPVFSIFLVYICIHLHIFAMDFEFLVSQMA